MKIIKITALFILFLCGNLFSQSGTLHHAQAPLDCKKCHVCNDPTYENPCLKLFPDFTREGLTIHHSADDAPEIMTLDTISGIYAPTVFTHKLHAEMSAMAGGCASCHHFNPPGEILTCIACHEPSHLRKDLTKPSLKGAYHQQCLACHQEWSHSTNCTVCHAKEGSEARTDKSEFIGKSHPEVKVPDKLVYETEAEGMHLVTFFHEQHNVLFNLECVDCHKNEACSRCHDTMKKTTETDKDIHDNCIDCHEDEVDENCEKCHDTKERMPFTHANTGWPLKKYHQNADCEDCHTTGKFSKLSRRCSSCHKKWDLDDFDHASTGVVLDENHIYNYCEDCHIDENYGKKPTCDNCHEDISYPAQLPGKMIK